VLSQVHEEHRTSHPSHAAHVLLNKTDSETDATKIEGPEPGALWFLRTWCHVGDVPLLFDLFCECLRCGQARGKGTWMGTWMGNSHVGQVRTAWSGWGP
jgi:hypothetical protein